MNKYLRLIAPVVLSLFFCAAVVGPAFGEDTIKANDNPDVTCSIQYKDGLPQINKEFKIVVKASYKGEPLLNLQPINNGAFEAINTTERAADGSPIFQLKAPSKPGTYASSFEGITSDGRTLLFSSPIKVYSEKSSSPTVGWIICVVIGAVIFGEMGAGIGSIDLANKSAALTGGLLGVLAGVIAGGFIGALFFSE